MPMSSPTGLSTRLNVYPMNDSDASAMIFGLQCVELHIDRESCMHRVQRTQMDVTRALAHLLLLRVVFQLFEFVEILSVDLRRHRRYDRRLLRAQRRPHNALIKVVLLDVIERQTVLVVADQRFHHIACRLGQVRLKKKNE